MEHQDWKPVILRKDSEPKRSVQHESGFKNKMNLDSSDPDPLRLLGAEAGKQLQMARTIKGWTQRELAQKINVKPHLIRDYEIGNVVPDKAILRRIEGILR
jgi:ribosome-binding protein aMBF1 (putative translation factor)